jgi:FkbM family methyltransferase
MKTKSFTYENINYAFQGIETDHIFKQIGLPNHPFYEFKMLKFIQELNIYGIYIDVGANIGNHSLFFANHCKCDYVVSFEPEHECHQLLIENMLTNSKKQFNIYRLGVWNENRMLYLERFENHNNMGLSKLTETDFVGKDSVEVVRLDDHVDYSDKIGLIKIDTEGAELKVLEGAVNIINAYHPVIICEAAEPKDKKILDEFLLGFGYPRSTKQFNATPTFVWRV